MADDVAVVCAPARATLHELAKLAAPVLRAAGAERAVAFGSFARGAADGFSDLDLAVVLPTELPPIERGNLLNELFLALPVGLDLLIYTPDEFARGLERGFGVFAAIEREGVTVYERSKR